MDNETVDRITKIVAWWGAIIATIVLILDIVKWIRSGARVRLTVRPNVYYHDAERVLVNDDGKGNREELIRRSIHVELRNTGFQPTTVLGIESERRIKGGGVNSYDGSRFQPHDDKALPYVLRPGEVWSCRVDQDLMSRLPGDGPVYVHITVSHREKPIVAELLNKTNDRDTR